MPIEGKLATPYQFGAAANAYARVGDAQSARRIVELASAKGFSGESNPALAVAAGNFDVAIEFYDRALDEGFPWWVGRDLHYLSGHAWFDPVREHPRFELLVKKAALPLAE